MSNSQHEIERKIARDTLSFSLKELMASEHIPGLAVVHLVSGKIHKECYLGKASVVAGIDIGHDTVFPVASLSKPVCALAILMLVNKRQLDLDIPIINYIPQEKLNLFLGKQFSDSSIQRITARMLLSHRSGFPNWRGEQRHWQKAQLPLFIKFEPGSRFEYSGEAFQLLGLLIESITGKEFNAFITEVIFKPFGMHNSSFVWKDNYDVVAAQPHNLLETFGILKPKEPMAAGSLHTTPRDYVKFLMRVMSYIHQGIFANIVTSHGAETILFNLGFGIEKTSDGETMLWHWGDGGPFKAFFLADPGRKDAVLYCTNSQTGLTIWNEVVRLTLGDVHPLENYPIMKDYLKMRQCFTNNPVRYTTQALSVGFFRAPPHSLREDISQSESHHELIISKL